MAPGERGNFFSRENRQCVLMHMSTGYTTLPEIAVVGLNEICPEIKSADKQWQWELVYRFCMAVTVIFCLRIVLLNATALLH